MSNLTRILEYLRDIVNAPTFNILIVFGCLLILGSFLSLDGLTNFRLMSQPYLVMFVTGWVLALCGFIYAGLNIVVGERGRRLKMAKIKDGLKLKLAQTTVNLKTGKIQDASGLDRDTAVVLPVNTAFIDNCIRDKNSATGAYILEFYADKVSAIPEIMSKQLEKFGHRKNENGTYAPGTTILLPSPYDTPAKVLMTASTIKKKKSVSYLVLLTFVNVYEIVSS